MINFSLLYESLPEMVSALLINLEISLVALVIGLLCALPLALAEASSNKLIKWPAVTYCLLFRGTPMIVQILCMFYVLPEFGVSLPPQVSVMLTIGLNSAAYLSQVLRSGLNAICESQALAAQALGLSSWQSYRYIILPQCFRTVLPSLGNEMITLLKDSGLASVVGIMEVVKVGSVIRGRTFEPFTVFFGLALLFLVLTGFISLLITQLEKWSHKPCSW